MIQIYILILLLVYGVMAASSLSYARYQEHQILGVTLSRLHAEHSEVERVKISFRKACYLCLFLSIGCSLLMLMPAIRSYADLVMFFMLGMNLFANWLVIDHYQKKLLHIKKENKWIYPRKNIAAVDLNVSRVKGKTRVSPVWVWLLLLLSFIPMVILLIHPDIQKIYPVGYSFIGPICQLCTIFQYYQMVNQPSKVLGEKTEINLLFAQEQERINSIAGVFISLSMFLFWIAFNFSVMYGGNGILVIAPAIFLIIILLVIKQWQENRTRKLEETFADTSYDDENIQEKKNTWKWGCYYDPDDPRIFVPKRIASMGFTINIGRPIGKVLYFGTIVLVLVVILFALYGGAEDYTIGLESSEITIDAAMYDRSFEKEQIVSVSLINQLPDGTRTNGYGGADKSFGHFRLDKYGKCMLYVYNNVDQYIVMELKEDDPGYVIVNDKTMEKTESLYQRINSWLSE